MTRLEQFSAAGFSAHRAKVIGTVKGPVGRTLAKYFRRYASGYGSVVALSLIYAVYLVGFASDRFAPETTAYVKSTSGAALEGFSSFSVLAPSAGVSDLMLVREYIHSADMMRKLDAYLGLRAHYTDKSRDMFSRLANGTTEEEFLEFYRDHIVVQIDAESGMLRIAAQGFTPEYSLVLSQSLLKESERFVNEVGQRIAESEVAFAEAELIKAQDKLSIVQNRLLSFQREHNMLSPEVESATVQGVVAEMQSELVRLRATEEELSAFLNHNAAELVLVRNRIKALEYQLDIEQEKLAGPKGEALSEMNMAFKELELRLQFATDIYKSTLKSLELSKVEAYKKIKHLVIVQSPSLPEEAAFPRKMHSLATLFVVLSLLYGVGVMTIATIKEHRDI